MRSCVGVTVLAMSVAGEAAASPWALRRLQPEAVAAGEPAPAAGSGSAAPVQPGPPPPVAGGPGSTDVPGTRPGAAEQRPIVLQQTPPPGGTGLIAGGIVVTILGAALVGGGAALIVRNRPRDDDGLAEDVVNTSASLGGIILIVLGVIPTIGGIAMTSVGVGRERDLHSWQQKQLSPAVGRTPQGSWTLGVKLAF